jgi:hypothetical protein
MTLLGYLQTGGVRGAIAKTAETVYDPLPSEQQRLARSVFLRLVSVGEDVEYTRRRATMDELLPRKELAATLDQLVETLIEARLLTVGDGRSVEVAHEALIRHWPRLQHWLAEDREGRLIHARLAETARDWQATQDKSAVLYRGARLASASEWAALHDDELNETERAFLDASQGAAVNELEQARRRTRRLRVLVATLAVLLAGAAVAAVLAVLQTGKARDQERVAVSRALAGQSLALLDRRLDQALLVALEAYRSERLSRPEARSSL